MSRPGFSTPWSKDNNLASKPQKAGDTFFETFRTIGVLAQVPNYSTEGVILCGFFESKKPAWIRKNCTETFRSQMIQFNITFDLRTSAGDGGVYISTLGPIRDLT